MTPYYEGFRMSFLKHVHFVSPLAHVVPLLRPTVYITLISKAYTRDLHTVGAFCVVNSWTYVHYLKPLIIIFNGTQLFPYTRNPLLGT